MDSVIGAVLIGAAIFLLLRARAVVGQRWAVPPRHSALGAAAMVLAFLVLLVVFDSAAIALVGGVVLGVLVYASWLLRRA